MGKIIILITVLLTCILANDKVEFYSPSFSCEKVKQGSIEYKICVDKELSNLDNKMTKIYLDVRYIDKSIKTYQLNWLQKRNSCVDVNCLKERYEQQIRTLEKKLALSKKVNNKKISKKVQNYIEIAKSATKTKLGNQRVNKKIYGTWELDHNKTLLLEFNEQKAKYGDFCQAFYDDLFEYKNIKVIEPILKGVDYNNSKLQEEMGACHEMGMELSFRTHGLYGKILSSPIIEEPSFWPSKFSLWKTDFNKDGNEELLFATYGRRFDKSPEFYILDKNLCEKAISKKGFDTRFDRVFLDWTQQSGPQKNLFEVMFVKYKNKKYLLNISDWKHHNKVKIRIYGREIKKSFTTYPDCAKTYFKNKGEK